jgi:predicted nucleic acid-binding Zn ribbon protein
MGPELTDPDATYAYKCGNCGQQFTYTIHEMSDHRASHIASRDDASREEIETPRDVRVHRVTHDA